MGDRLATKDMDQKVGAAVALSVGGAGSPSNTVSPGQRPIPILLNQWHLDPTSRLTNIDMGRKVGLLYPFPEGQALGPH